MLRIIFIILIAICATYAYSAAPVIQAVEVDDAPIIDGNLDDTCWQEIPELTGFIDISTKKLCPLQTTVKLCYDKENVYVAIHASHPDPSKIKVDETKRNSEGIFKDDYVEIAIDSLHKHQDASKFSVNAIGTQFESLEGGSANKIEWRGDWHAAGKITSDGYNVEMAIPFSILKYDKRRDSFGIAVLRHLAAENIDTQWPDMQGVWDAKLYADWNGIKTPRIRPKPAIMSYLLGSNIDDGNRRLYRGIDIKYPFTTDKIALISVTPDFSTVEQQVQSACFTYTEPVQQDYRPFFQEWDIPTDAFVFYSRKIEDFDIGAKFVGKDGANTYGILNINSFGNANDTFISYNRLIGSQSSIGFETVNHQEPGRRNTVFTCTGDIGWNTDRRFHHIYFGEYISSTTDTLDGNATLLKYVSSGSEDDWAYGCWYNICDETYNAELGHIYSIIDQKGIGWDVSKRWGFRNQKLNRISFAANGYNINHIDGSPYQNGYTIRAGALYVDGKSFAFSYNKSTWEQFHDVAYDITTYWNSNSIRKIGLSQITWGRKAGGPLLYTLISQNLQLSEYSALQLSYEREKIGSPSPYADTRSQFIATLNYDLTNEKSIGGRLVDRNGSRNLYMIYRQQVRRGTDIYFIYGDPNAEKTTGKLSVKLVKPMK